MDAPTLFRQYKPPLFSRRCRKLQKPGQDDRGIPAVSISRFSVKLEVFYETKIAYEQLATINRETEIFIPLPITLELSIVWQFPI